MDKIVCLVCNRPLKDPLSRKIKCGPHCLKILNEARNIYKAKSKKCKRVELSGQTNLFEEWVILKIGIKCTGCGKKHKEYITTLKKARKIKRLLNMKYVCPTCKFRKLVINQLCNGY